MKIIMTQTENGSVDGIRVSIFVAGGEYDLTNTPGARDLASAFVAAGMAREAPGAKAESAKPLVVSEVVAPVATPVAAQVAAQVAAPVAPKHGRKQK